MRNSSRRRTHIRSTFENSNDHVRNIALLLEISIEFSYELSYARKFEMSKLLRLAEILYGKKVRSFSPKNDKMFEIRPNSLSFLLHSTVVGCWSNSESVSLQWDNFLLLDRSKTGRVRAKTCLTRRCDRRLPASYFKPL